LDLILVRHGLPERSHVSADPPLSETGRAQAARVAAHLAGEAIDCVWASTMRRAIETAEPLASAAGFGLRTHAGICEYDRGAGRYVPNEVLKAEDYEAWRRMAGGDGQDLGAFQVEVAAGLEQIIAENPGGRVVVFCHGGVINVWTAHVLGMPARLFFAPDYTSINRYVCSRRGERAVVSLNERHHLREIV